MKSSFESIHIHVSIYAPVDLSITIARGLSTCFEIPPIVEIPILYNFHIIQIVFKFILFWFQSVATIPMFVTKQ